MGGRKNTKLINYLSVIFNIETTFIEDSLLLFCQYTVKRETNSKFDMDDNYNSLKLDTVLLFLAAIAAQYGTMSVGRSVGMSVCLSVCR